MADDTEPDPRPIRILIAFRPDSTSHDAVEFAAWLARTAPVRVRAVTAFVRPWPATSLKKMGGKYGKWFSREAKAAKKSVTRAFEDAGIPRDQWDEEVSVFADGPSEHTLITEAADDYGADIVALDPQSTAPKGRFSLSSTADALLHSSPKPVSLSPRKVRLSKKGVRRVNFAYLDGDYEGDDSALFFAARRALEWGVPLRVLAFSPTGISDTPLEDNLDLSRELSADWREHSLAMLDRVRDWLSEQTPELEVESAVATGNGWGGAVDALKWKKGDLLCLASNPVGPIERVFVGSATSEFLPYVGVPVIIYPVPEA